MSEEATTEPVPQEEPAAAPPVAEERRAAFRLNKVLGAEIEHEDMKFQARLFVIDISATGFRATNQFELPVAVDLKVRIILQKNEAVECGARIVWSKELPMSGMFQFGFEFQGLSEEDQQKLEKFIESERQAANKPAPSTYLGRPWTTIRD